MTLYKEQEQSICHIWKCMGILLITYTFLTLFTRKKTILLHLIFSIWNKKIFSFGIFGFSVLKVRLFQEFEKNCTVWNCYVKIRVFIEFLKVFWVHTYIVPKALVIWSTILYYLSLFFLFFFKLITTLKIWLEIMRKIS